MGFVTPDESRRTEQKSSVYQFHDFLAVRRGDEWVPIAFDSLDGITCDTVHSHKAVLTRKPYIGYVFPVGERNVSEATYLLSDQKGVEVKKLPSFYGGGFYESSYDRKVFVNGANGALGTEDNASLRVGLDYVLAKHSMKPVK